MLVKASTSWAEAILKFSNNTVSCMANLNSEKSYSMTKNWKIRLDYFATEENVMTIKREEMKLKEVSTYVLCAYLWMFILNSDSRVICICQ